MLPFYRSIIVRSIDPQLIALRGKGGTDVIKQMGIYVFLAAGDQDRYVVLPYVRRETGSIGAAALSAFNQPPVPQKREGCPHGLTTDLVLFGKLCLGGKSCDSFLEILCNLFRKSFRKCFVFAHSKKSLFLFMVCLQIITYLFTKNVMAGKIHRQIVFFIIFAIKRFAGFFWCSL